MKKSFCDKCHNEITTENFYSMNGLLVNVCDMEFKIIPPDAVPIDFDICKYCVIDAVQNLADRPKATN